MWRYYKMTDYTRQELKELRHTLQSVLDKAGIAGITIAVGNCSYEGVDQI